MDKSKEFQDLLDTDKLYSLTFSKVVVKDIIAEGYRRHSIVKSQFSEVCFTNVVFSTCRVGYSIFKKCTFTRCEFQDCTFDATDLVDCKFVDCKFVDCGFPKSAFKSCEYSGDIIYCNFLNGADLRGLSTNKGFTNCHINLSTIIDYDSFEFESTRVIKEGDIIVYKKAVSPERASRVIIELLIPKEAKRSQAFSNKCRAEFAIVKSIRTIGGGETLDLVRAVSFHASQFNYRVGETVRPEGPFNEDWRVECASGIHFFMTEEEAMNYF